MKLYTMAGTCALACNIAVAWTDAPIEIVNLERGAHRAPDYLAVNPRGQVPALVMDDGSVLTEAIAILSFIGAKFGSDDYARDRELGYREAEALSYLSSEVHAAFKGHFSPGTFADTPKTEKTVRHKTYDRLRPMFARLDEQAGASDGPWLLERRSFADGYLYICGRWLDRTPIDLDDYPHLLTQQQAMEADDGVRLALARQGMTPATAP